MAKKSDIVLCSGWNIGQVDAMHDEAFLRDCFIRMSEYEELKNPHSIRSILVGRTGAGKTAFMMQLQKECSHCIEINAEQLALDYISQQAWIQNLEANDISFFPFFKMLWKHILMIELIQKEFSSEEELFQRIMGWFARRKSKTVRNRERAVTDYLNEWGSNFWKEEKTVLKEVTDATLSRIDATAGTPRFSVSGQGENEKITHEQKVLIQDQIVDQKQLAGLEQVIECVGEHLNENGQKFYYILIDRLDEVALNEDVKQKILKALIGVIRDFHIPKMPVKVIPAIRNDLLETVYKTNLDPGYQTEKFKAFEVEIKWTKDKLAELVKKRVTEMFKHQYSPRSRVEFSHLFPSKYRKGKFSVPIFDYLIERTLNRPRDIIVFVNHCLQEATGRYDIVPAQIARAEEKYSQGRFQSLIDEWRSAYPNLDKYAEILRQPNSEFDFSVLQDMVEKFLYEDGGEDSDDAIVREGINEIDKKGSCRKTTIQLAKIFYQVGLIKIKIHPQDATISEYPNNISEGQYESGMKIYIHPMFHKELGVIPAVAKRKKYQKS